MADEELKFKGGRWRKSGKFASKKEVKEHFRSQGWEFLRVKTSKRHPVTPEGKDVVHVGAAKGLTLKNVKARLKATAESLSTKKFKKVLREEEEERKPLYRISKVFMVYAQIKKGVTPDPLAEIRIFIYTRNPDKYSRYHFDEPKDKLVWNRRNSLSQKNTSYRIEGFEKEQVDEDELEGEEEEMQYYIAFFDEHGNIKPKGEDTGYVRDL